MAGGLNIDITADTRQFQAQVDNVPKELQKITDQLQAVTKDGDRAGGSLESSMRQAQAATDDSTATFRNYTRTVTSSVAEQNEAFELSNREINHIQKESLSTVGATLAQTIESSATAVDGSVSSVLDGLSNIATGVAVFSKNDKLAAGAAGAALAVTSIGALFEKSEQAAKDEAAAVSDVTTALEKLGKDGTSSVSSINDQLKTFSTTTDGSDKDLEALKKTADDAGVSWVQYARAVAGSIPDQEKLFAQVQQQINALLAQSRTMDLNTDAGSRNYGVVMARIGALQSVSDELVKQNTTLGESTDRVNDLAAAQEGAAQTDQLTADVIKSVDGAYGSAASAAQNYLDQKSGLLNVQGYIDAMTREQKALEDYQSSLATSGLSATAKEYLSTLGADSAAQLLAGYVGASQAQKGALDNIWTIAGQSSSGAYVKGLSGALPASITGPAVVPNVDTSSIEATIRKSLSTFDSYVWRPKIEPRVSFGSNVL